MDSLNTKIPVTILGATGCVGQQFVVLLAEHPWFDIKHVCASERSAGKSYGEAVNWIMTSPLPEKISCLTVETCYPENQTQLVFSGLSSKMAENIEQDYAKAGCFVVSNSSPHRMHAAIPLVIPEVNPDHLALLGQQKQTIGKIVTNPNCSAIGLTMALKPLNDRFGIKCVHAVTLQALSGAGFPGVASLSITDNIVPYINGEEEKIEAEPLKILGAFDAHSKTIREANFKISAHCNRVNVIDGHIACVSISFECKPTPHQVIDCWQKFSALPQHLNLPSAPKHPLHYFNQASYPQPRLHRDLDKSMAVSIGRLRECSFFDYKFCLLSHNRVRGAAGTAVLNAELLYEQGYLT